MFRAMTVDVVHGKFNICHEREWRFTAHKSYVKQLLITTS